MNGAVSSYCYSLKPLGILPNPWFPVHKKSAALCSRNKSEPGLDLVWWVQCVACWLIVVCSCWQIFCSKQWLGGVCCAWRILECLLVEVACPRASCLATGSVETSCGQWLLDWVVLMGQIRCYSCQYVMLSTCSCRGQICWILPLCWIDIFLWFVFLFDYLFDCLSLLVLFNVNLRLLMFICIWIWYPALYCLGISEFHFHLALGCSCGGFPLLACICIFLCAETRLSLHTLLHITLASLWPITC